LQAAEYRANRKDGSLIFKTLLGAFACPPLPVQSNPDNAYFIGTKKVPVRVRSRKSYSSAYPRHQSFWCAFLWSGVPRGVEPAGQAVTPGLLTRYRPTAKNPLIVGLLLGARADDHDE
jgi:hypothetical protein